MKSKNQKPLKSLLNPIHNSISSVTSQNKDNPEIAIKNSKLHYPEFTYLAIELSAFTFLIDTFIILLRDGCVINHKPANAHMFHKWLVENNIRDLEEDNN